MGRTRIVTARRAANLAMAHVAEAAPVSKDVERPGVAAAGGLRRVGVRGFVVERDSPLVRHARMFHAVENQIRPLDPAARTSKSDLPRYALLGGARFWGAFPSTRLSSGRV